MKNLNKIREIILKQDKELEDILIKYFNQNKSIDKTIHKEDNIEKYILETKSKIENLIYNNDIKKAENLLYEYKNIVGVDTNYLSLEGIIKLNKNDLKGSIECFLEVLKIDKNNVDILYNLGYINNLVGNYEQAKHYYEKCLSITKDKNLINELNQLIQSLKITKNYTLITLGFDKNDILFDNINKEVNNIINIVENENIKFENKYYEQDITTIEVPLNNNTVIDDIISKNSNCIVLYNNVYKLDYIKSIKNKAKLVYYPNDDYNIVESDYLNFDLYKLYDKELCDISDVVIVDDISNYNTKKIIERRDNIYINNPNLGKEFEIENILNNHNNFNLHYLDDCIKLYGKNTYDEYIESLYVIASEHKNINNCIEICKYIYEKYNTKEIYDLYISLLSQDSRYEELVFTIINFNYCEDFYKAEIIYLNAIKNYELLKFITNISIKNYRVFDTIYDDKYKNAFYKFTFNYFYESYKDYLEILNTNSNLSNSPLVNKNLSYIMYATGNEEYKKFYDFYKELLKECLSK